jgi:hypothetical protein
MKDQKTNQKTPKIYFKKKQQENSADKKSRLQKKEDLPPALARRPTAGVV